MQLFEHHFLAIWFAFEVDVIKRQLYFGVPRFSSVSSGVSSDCNRNTIFHHFKEIQLNSKLLQANMKSGSF